MKLTKSNLRQIIKEEFKYLREGLNPEKEHFFKKIKGKWAKVHWPKGKDMPEGYVNVPANTNGFPYDDFGARQEALNSMSGQLQEKGFGEGEPPKGEWGKKQTITLEEEEPLEEAYFDADWATFFEAMIQVANNFGVAVYPAIAAALGVTAKEVADAVKNKKGKVDEKKLTEPEKQEKEKIVKGMKKNKSDFKDRYGKDAESVMYATATKIAKEKA